MLETRRDAIEGRVQQRIRACRDSPSEAASPADLSTEPAYENLAFTFVEMQAQTLTNITPHSSGCAAATMASAMSRFPRSAARCPLRPRALRARGALGISSYAVAALVSIGPTCAAVQ